MVFLKKIGTPLTIFSSFVVLGTGLWMYFLSKNKLLEEIHSQIGIVFFVAVILHIIVNKSSFFRLLTIKKTYLSAVIVLCVGLGVIYLQTKSGDQQKVPIGLLMHELESAQLDHLSVLFKKNENELKEKLVNKGYTVSDLNLSIEEFAKINQKESKETLNAILSILLGK